MTNKFKIDVFFSNVTIIIFHLTSLYMFTKRLDESIPNQNSISSPLDIKLIVLFLVCFSIKPLSCDNESKHLFFSRPF